MELDEHRVLEVRRAEGQLYVHVGLAVQQKVRLVKPLLSAKLAVRYKPQLTALPRPEVSVVFH